MSTTATLDLAMLGPSGSGKTTLLTSMYTTLAKIPEQTQLLLTPDDDRTQLELNDYQSQMEKMSHSRLIREQAITGTKGIRPHNFRLALAAGFGPAVHVDLRFTDYEGGLLTSSSVTDALRQRLNATDIMLVTIDTPALMAEEGRWHGEINKHFLMNERLKEWAGHQRRSLVMFVPLKCEAWTRTGRASEVVEAVRKGYEAPIGTLKQLGVRRGVVCPVESLGSHEFMHFEVRDEIPYARFRMFPGGHYSPRWADAPLRLILQAAATKREDNRSWLESSIEWFTDRDKKFRRAVDSFAANGAECIEGLW